MSDYTAALKGLTLNELYKEFANTSASMRIELATTPIVLTKKSDDRTYNLNRLITINNEIRRRGSDAK